MKYELTDRVKRLDIGDRNYIPIFRIRALEDIISEWGLINVMAGELGGWVESESNLSQEGSCWIEEDAIVRENANISGDASVFGNACVGGNARVFDNARVYGNSRVFGRSRVCGRAVVFCEAIICGDSLISENAIIGDRARICGNAVIGGTRVIGDNSVISNGEFTGLGGQHRTEVIMRESVVKPELRFIKSALEIRREIWESITTHDIYDLVGSKV